MDDSAAEIEQVVPENLTAVVNQIGQQTGDRDHDEQAQQSQRRYCQFGQIPVVVNKSEEEHHCQAGIQQQHSQLELNQKPAGKPGEGCSACNPPAAQNQPRKNQQHAGCSLGQPE